jgi:HEAT repeat protein
MDSADPLLARVEALAAGDFHRGPGVPLGGSPAPWDRAREIAALGAEAFPRVIVLLAERRWRDLPGLNALLTALVLLGDPRAVAPLTTLLEELADRPEEQARVAEALGRLGFPEGLPPLLRLLGRRTAGPQARREAARWLGVREHREAVPRLQEVFLDRSEPMLLRADAASSLGRLGGDLAATTLVAHLEIEPSAELVQRMAEALGDTGSPLAAHALRRLKSEHPDALVRRAAAEALDLLWEDARC